MSRIGSELDPTKLLHITLYISPIILSHFCCLCSLNYDALLFQCCHPFLILEDIHYILTQKWLAENSYKGTVSKQVTNASQTAYGFLCVSLGSSTIQLHDSIGNRLANSSSETSFGSQNDDRAWGVYYRKVAFVVRLFVGKILTPKNIHNYIFPV